MLYRVDGAQVRNADTGEVHRDLVGQAIRIVIRDTTTAFPIQDNAGDPISDSDLIVIPTFEIPWFWIDTDTPADLYLDWLHVASGVRGSVNFEAVLREAIRAAQETANAAVKTVNGVAPGEDGDVQVDAGGVDDAGMAELIETPASDTALALEVLYGKGFVFLDLDDDPPPGTVDGVVLLRTAGGGTPPPVPVQYMQDLFERTVAAGSIGAPSSGGSYSLIDIPADWSVGSGAGRWIAPAAGTRGGFIRSANYSQETVEIIGIVSQETGAVGNRVISVSPRRIVASSTQYAMNITLRGPTAASRPLQVDLGLQKGVTEGDLQSATAGVVTTGALGQKVRFRMQVIQEDPATTRVRARVWLDGNEEPTTWQKDATDTTVAMQGPGSLAILVRQNSPETVGSEARIHEYTVQSIV